MQPLTPKQKIIGGALVAAGLLMVASSRNEDDDEDLDDVEWVFYRTDGKCFYCEKELVLEDHGKVGKRGGWQMDHFIPFVSRGADQPYNLVPACVDCNGRKSDLMPWEFDPDTFAVNDRRAENYL